MSRADRLKEARRVLILFNMSAALTWEQAYKVEGKIVELKLMAILAGASVPE